MPFVSGFLRLRSKGGLHPDNTLPETGGPVDPGFGGGLPAQPDPDFDLPAPPPGVWPPPNATLPIVPAPPSVPPGTIWPPPPGMDNTLPGGPPGHPSAPDGPPKRFWIVAGIPGYGWRYVCVDPSLTIDNTLPPTATPK